MRHTSSFRPRSRCILFLLGILFCASGALAQFTMQPSIGLSTMWYNGDYPIKQPISPGNARDLPLGGGIIGNSNGLHLQLELIPEPNSTLRIPISLNAFFLDGKTTFAASRTTDKEQKRWLFSHTAQIYQLGTGVTASFFGNPSLYVTAEGKLNYIPPTTVVSRIYQVKDGQIFNDCQGCAETSFQPSPEAKTRFGAYVGVGTQVDFFDPFMLDFSIGYGALNLAGKESDVTQQHNLLVVDPGPAPEVTIGYIGINFSVIYRP